MHELLRTAIAILLLGLHLRRLRRLRDHLPMLELLRMQRPHAHAAARAHAAPAHAAARAVRRSWSARRSAPRRCPRLSVASSTDTR